MGGRARKKGGKGKGREEREGEGGERDKCCPPNLRRLATPLICNP